MTMDVKVKAIAGFKASEEASAQVQLLRLSFQLKTISMQISKMAAFAVTMIQTNSSQLSRISEVSTSAI